MADSAPDIGEAAEQAELRQLVRSALGGRNSGERDMIELSLRDEMDGVDAAAALGVPRNQVHARASRARTQFETALGALLVARYGQDACPYLATILDGWNGELTVLLRKRINRHIENCEICDERKRHELSPAALLSLLPVALLPVGLRRELFRLVSDRSPVAAEHRDLVVRLAWLRSPDGFLGPCLRPAAGAPDVLPDGAAHRGGRGRRAAARGRRGVRGRPDAPRRGGTRRAGRHPVRWRRLVRQWAGAPDRTARAAPGSMTSPPRTRRPARLRPRVALSRPPPPRPPGAARPRARPRRAAGRPRRPRRPRRRRCRAP